MPKGPKDEKRPADVIGASCRNGLARLIDPGARRWVKIKNPKAPAVKRQRPLRPSCRRSAKPNKRQKRRLEVAIPNQRIFARLGSRLKDKRGDDPHITADRNGWILRETILPIAMFELGARGLTGFMAEERVNRKLAAILAADVVGYSRLMASDEEATLAALKRHRQTVFEPAVAAHQGRIVKLIGDGTIVEFASIVDAVNCALSVQRSGDPLRDESLPHPKIVLRIGINLGDVIIEGDDIYGDGVNIAARLEPVAEPGGICISSIVNESIGNRIDARFEDGGQINVKNIDRPIRIWRWHPNSAQASAINGRQPNAANLEPHAAIAILPFTNMSGDPEQEYFSDGISEDIITDLSKIAGLMGIARNSSFTYKGRSVDVRTIGRELDVQSVLEGSIRRAGNRVRITAQLIDATSGGHLWADRYDRDLTDIFEVQDDVTRRIVDALKVTLSSGEKERLADTKTSNLAAYDCLL